MRRVRGDKGELIAAEGAGVLTGLPDIELGLHQRERHGEPIATDGFRYGHYVGNNVYALK